MGKCRKCIRSRGRFGCKGKCKRFRRRKPKSMKKCKKGKCYRKKHYRAIWKKKRVLRKKRCALRKKCRKCIRSRGRFGCKGKCKTFRRRKPKSIRKCKKGKCYRLKRKSLQKWAK